MADERLSIRRLDGAPDERWDALCLAAGCPWHARALADLQGEFGVACVRVVAESGRMMVGAISVFLAGARRMKSVDALVGRVATVPAGPALVAAPPGTAAALVGAAHEAIRAERAVSAAWRLDLPDPEAEQTLRGLGYGLRPIGVGIAELPESADDLESAIHSKSRNLVRKARKCGVSVAPEAGVETLLPLLDASFRRSGLEPRDAAWVRRAFGRLGCEVLVARQGVRPIAAVMWQPFGVLGRYLFHGRTEGDTVGASNLLLLEMFRRAHARGVRTFHAGEVALEGETDESLLGITHFKERMGFRVVRTHEATLVLRPVGKAVRDTALVAWRRVRARKGGAR